MCSIKITFIYIIFFTTGSDINSSIASKPLTPYYSKPSFFEEGDSKIEVDDLAKDPFDTSFVSQIPPGKAEIKLLESELIDSHQYSTSNIKTSLSDQDFNPRDNELDQEIILQPPVSFEINILLK